MHFAFTIELQTVSLGASPISAVGVQAATNTKTDIAMNKYIADFITVFIIFNLHSSESELKPADSGARFQSSIPYTASILHLLKYFFAKDYK